MTPSHAHLEAELADTLARLDTAALARAGLRRDPGGYNLVVHFLPPELARDHAADADLRERLGRPTGPIGLYLHVPPCTGRCTFCHYAIEVNPTAGRLDRYLMAMEREMTVRWGQGALGPVRSVLIGGGTPTYLEAAQLDRLLGHLRRTVDLPNDVEFTVESSPETLTAEKLAVLRDHGVNRLNVGIQAFDDRLLRSLARRHDGQGALDAVRLAQAAGFGNVNIDLIYALPGQDLETWLQSLDIATDLGVQSITTYHLRKRPDTAISRNPSPAEDLNLRMHLGAIRLLEARGYRQSLTDYFCLANEETAQVQARDKWRDMQPVDGCGLEACSRRPDVVAFNHGELDAYCDAVQASGGWALANGRLLSRPEQMAQRAMFALKVLDDDGGFSRAGFEAEFGEPADGIFGSVTAELTGLGVLRDDGDRLQLTEVGTLFADEVCQRLQTPELHRRLLARVQVDPAGAPVPLPRGSARGEARAADVLVIGGGMAGVATAMALAEDLGAGVLLLEAGRGLGLGASSASIGGFRIQHEDPILAGLTADALPQLLALTDQTGIDVRVRHDGYVFLATTPADADRLQQHATAGRTHGWPVDLLVAADLAARLPGVNLDDVVAAVWGARDGHLDPERLVQACQRRLTARSGRVRTGAVVRGLVIERGRVLGVHTDAGPVLADTVVLAAGEASGALLAAAGVRLPLRTIRRHVFRAPLPQPMRQEGGAPLVLTWTPPLYFRADGDELVLSAWENGAVADTSPEAVLATVRERAGQRLPHLDSRSVRPAWSGVQVLGPDARPLVGPCPGLDGLVLVGALAGHGILHSLPLGRLAAAWVLRTAQGPRAEALDPRRFSLTA